MKVPYKIALHYMASRYFLIDVLSVLGSGVFVNIYTRLEFLSLFKIARIRRLGLFIQRLNFDIERKSLLNILKIITYLVLLLHFQACAWWYVIEIKGRVLNYN